MSFDEKYFEKYQIKSIFGLEKGEKPFFYSFWIRKLKYLKLKYFPTEKIRVLEVGFGGGYFLQRLEKVKNIELFGIDISPYALEYAKRRIRFASLHLGKGEDLPFEDNFFSVIFAFDVIEHMQDPEKFFIESYRTLQDFGILIFSTPNPESFGAKVKAKKQQFELPYEERYDEWFGWRDPTHINIKTKEEWRKILKKVGFDVLKDGTDTLWDVPYINGIPAIIQKVVFMPFHYVLTYLFCFFPWKWGENYVCIAQKGSKKL
jgi:SAM-dependent methyltransferase